MLRFLVKLSCGLPLLVCLITAGIRASGQNTVSDDSSGNQQDLPEVTVKPDQSPLRAYQGAYPRINDLVDTRLDVRFDFGKKYLYGKEWVTLQPHFYPTDSLTLDAKGMDIHEVDRIEDAKMIPLKYDYDGWELRIRLGNFFTRKEKYTIYIDYTSKPDELKDIHGSAAITSAKGLYFINPDGKDPYKPTEVWTQGETESNSVWFPTIDKPDQKTLEQITMTVPDQFTTLSNGRLLTQKKNTDGTRSDTWKMDHPNSPYLFMMAAGPFVIVKDHWKDVPVDFYVEKVYAPYAMDIFGRTPAMIDFYSTILGVPYQWSKYDQVIVRDYVSGAMENTTATLHGEFMYTTRRQLLDDDYANESVYAHELFHHWFGDLVTCESWSNLTLNESFADFSEMLWATHAYGPDQGDAHSYSAMQDYFRFAAGGADHPLVDYYYKDKEDVFDVVTYQKGGRVLNMLKHVVGDDAFFRSLQYYLETHKFQPAQIQQLRLAFEHITGKDLNWFWNQWYFGDGYPKLDISYIYLDNPQQVSVVVRQTQAGQLFELPFAIDIYEQGHATRHWVTMMDRTDTFTYSYQTKPDLVNVDAEKALLTQKSDHKTIANYIYQYDHAPLYLDRREAITACDSLQDSNSGARGVLMDALKGDPFYGLKDLVEEDLNMSDNAVSTDAIPILKNLVLNDPNSGVRAGALETLVKSAQDNLYPDLIEHALADSSYRVESAGLGALAKYDSTAAYAKARTMENDAYSPLSETICSILAHHGDTADFGYIHSSFERTGSFSKFAFINPFLHMLADRITDNASVDEGIDEVKAFGEDLGPQYGMYVVSMLQTFAKQKNASASTETDPALKSALQAQAEYGTDAANTLQQSFSGQ